MRKLNQYYMIGYKKLNQLIVMKLILFIYLGIISSKETLALDKS